MKVLKAVFLAVLPLALGAMGPESPRDVLRVGFFEYAGYQDRDMEGNYSGYGYELLQLLRAYGGWDYEYVGFTRGWASMPTLLTAGEIDFCVAEKTPERERLFDYTASPVGRTWTSITVRRDNQRFRPDDFSHWNGIRVGLLRDSAPNANFAAFAEKKGFSFVVKTYTEASELEAALVQGEVDVLVSDALRRRAPVEVELAAFDARPFYFMVKKGNSVLLERLDQALQRLVRDHPTLLRDLRAKYYPNEMKPTSVDVLRPEERLAFAGRTFRVLMHGENPPLCEVESGRPKGILVDLIDLLQRKSDLRFDLDVVPTSADESVALTNDPPALVADFNYNDLQGAERLGYALTSPGISLPVSLVRTRRSFGRLESLATLSDVCGPTDYEQVFPGVRVVTCGTVAELESALEQDRVEGALMFTSAAVRFVGDSHDYQITPVEGVTSDFCLAISTEMPRMFTDAMLRVLAGVLPGEIDEILARHMVAAVRPFTLEDWFAEHLPLVSVGLALVIAGLLALVFHLRRAVLRSRRTEDALRSVFDHTPVLLFVKSCTTQK